MHLHYDEIGTTYSHTRRPDPRIARIVDEALGGARTVVNVGAGTGSYEPAGRDVVAVEPSPTMIRQRASDAAPVVQASAESLPFGDGSFDAALAVLTVHHWSDPARGLRELRRVARDRVVVLTWDPKMADAFWLVEYLPALRVVDIPRFPQLEQYEEALGTIDVAAVPVPHDCSDGFLCANWRRPSAYLDPVVRANCSAFHLLPEDELRAGLERLEADLVSGAWEERHAELLAREELDCGYRLVTAGG
jgi:SAM-dependent methyltransferase